LKLHVCLSVQVLKPISQKKSLAAKGKKVFYVTSSPVWQQKENSKQGKGRGTAGQANQKDLRNFRMWFSGHDFQNLGSQLWGLEKFRIWFSRHGFQDLGSQLWSLDFHISILGPGFHTGGFTVAFGHGHPLVALVGHKFQQFKHNLYCLGFGTFIEINMYM